MIARFLKWWNTPRRYTKTFATEREALAFAAQVEELWPGAEVKISDDPFADICIDLTRYRGVEEREEAEACTQAYRRGEIR